MVPARALHSHRRLFACLQDIFPVVFDGRAPDDLGSLDGVLVLEPVDLHGLPAGVGVLFTAQAGESAPRRQQVNFARSERVARALRGRGLSEDLAHGRARAPFANGDSVLATVGGTPVWWRRADTEVSLSAFSVAELGEGETLREHLRPGRFMGLVPILHFLRDACRELNWTEQPLRASFVIDDPNLHWPSYGFLNYANLIRHASAHRFHVGLAMVPLDGWLINRRAAALFKSNGEVLSLLVHGNDHVASELGRLATNRAAELAVGQALRRIAGFERRSGVAVKRVMVPPHGACSEAALGAMLRLGFDAACISRPYPWRDRLPAPSALAGWYPSELVAGGLPILPRYHLDRPREELVFRALLGQPLILYGHHWDFAEGLDAFTRAAQDINSLGDVRWGPLDWIASHNYWARRAGEVLLVQMHSRKVRVDVPDGVTSVRVQTKEIHGEPLWRGVTCGHGRAGMMRAAGGWRSDSLEVAPGSEVELSLQPEHPLDAATLADPPARPWPITRRMLVECRDRVRPLSARR